MVHKLVNIYTRL